MTPRHVRELGGGLQTSKIQKKKKKKRRRHARTKAVVRQWLTKPGARAGKRRSRSRWVRECVAVEMKSQETGSDRFVRRWHERRLSDSVVSSVEIDGRRSPLNPLRKRQKWLSDDSSAGDWAHKDQRRGDARLCRFFGVGWVSCALLVPLPFPPLPLCRLP
jgi:hypothetical protein